MSKGFWEPETDRRRLEPILKVLIRSSKPHPWRQRRADDPAYFEYYHSRYGAAESEADGWFTAACGPMV